MFLYKKPNDHDFIPEQIYTFFFDTGGMSVKRTFNTSKWLLSTDDGVPASKPHYDPCSLIAQVISDHITNLINLPATQITLLKSGLETLLCKPTSIAKNIFWMNLLLSDTRLGLYTCIYIVSPCVFVYTKIAFCIKWNYWPTKL